MREIGGYIEIDEYSLPMLHEEAIMLNTARNCLAYLIEKKKIVSIALPKFLCDSVSQVCRERGVEIHYYSIDTNFEPVDMDLEDGVWLYVVNYYGLIDNTNILELKRKYGNLIIDNVQAYYQKPVEGVDTIYTCRKFFGVPDGAFLYTDLNMDEELEQDYSYERIRHLLGRYEKSALDFYDEYVMEEKLFSRQPIMKMSKLTYNMLHAIDYDKVKNKRIENFKCLYSGLADINQLKFHKLMECPFAYPLFIKDGNAIRKMLQQNKIYVPTLWPDVFHVCKESDVEYQMAENILPLPIDQRYSVQDMDYVITILRKCLSVQ